MISTWFHIFVTFVSCVFCMRLVLETTFYHNFSFFSTLFSYITLAGATRFSFFVSCFSWFVREQNSLWRIPIFLTWPINTDKSMCQESVSLAAYKPLQTHFILRLFFLLLHRLLDIFHILLSSTRAQWP